MKIAILGFGREGKSLLKFLQKTQINADYHADKRGYISENQRKHLRKSASDEIWVLDKNSRVQIPQGVKTCLGKNYLKNLERFDIIFRSPGVPYLLPEIQKAERQGVKISSATKLFLEQLRGHAQTTRRLTRKKVGVGQRQVSVSQRPILIGVTGTKGKGTTSTLLYKILQASGKKVFLAGNIGKPSLDILSKTQTNMKISQRKSALSLRKSAPIVILELSSFQLQDLKKSPSIAAVLDIFPDHLDAHKNLKEYYDAKANIARYQKSGDKIFFFGNNNLSRYVASKGRGKKIAVDEKSFKLFSADELFVKGAHNFKNAVMAATIAKSLDVPEKIILGTAKKFRGLEHRMEFVRNVGGVSYCNDSAAVNPGSAIAALETAGKNTILIAGGKERGLDYSKFAEAVGKYAKSVILIGENKTALSRAIKKASAKKRVPIVFAKNMKEAVTTAYRQATNYKLQATNCNILLSPASASFDMFKDYGERGKIFKKEVQRLR